MKAKNWIITFVLLSVVMLGMVAALVIYVDPFFHYHKPLEKLYYPLRNNDERYINNGITKNFDYDAIITGTSMCEGFLGSQLDELFGVNTIKIPCFGASYKELDQQLAAAFEYNDGIKLIVRGLDADSLFDDKDHMGFLSDIYPTYLFDNNPFNDVKYWFYSRAVNQSVNLLRGYFNGAEGGITDFDKFALRTNDPEPYPPTLALEGRATFAQPTETLVLSDEERETIIGNVRQNVLELPLAHPETEFYYFFTPYSAIWWGEQYGKGNITRQIEAERLAIETMLQSGCENLKLFSFNTCFDLTTNISNYRDYKHYGRWINRRLLQSMADGEGLLTADNYEDYLKTEAEFYGNFDYNSLFDTAAGAEVG